MVKIWRDGEYYNSGFANYGDKDFFQRGVLINTERPGREIEMIYCRPYEDEEDKYMFGELMVDYADPWISRKEVMRFAGMTEETFDPVQFAIACVDYYGPLEFGAGGTYLYDWRNMTRKKIEKVLRSRSIYLDHMREMPPLPPGDQERENDVVRILNAIQDMDYDNVHQRMDEIMQSAVRLYDAEMHVDSIPRVADALREAGRTLRYPVTQYDAQRFVDKLAMALGNRGILHSRPEQEPFRRSIYERFNAVAEKWGESISFEEFVTGHYRLRTELLNQVMTTDEKRKHGKDPIVLSKDIYRDLHREERKQNRIVERGRGR